VRDVVVVVVIDMDSGLEFDLDWHGVLARGHRARLSLAVYSQICLSFKFRFPNI
jgi:hypothetical protein